MAKTIRNPATGEVRTVTESEAEKLCAAGWAYTSKYEIKRQRDIARQRAAKTQAA